MISPEGKKKEMASDQVAFVLFACETGGRWSPEALELVRALARWRVRDLPPLIRTSFRMAYPRRWWGLLSCTVQDSVAASLDPTDRILHTVEAFQRSMKSMR